MRVGARLEILGLDSNLEGVCGFSHGIWYFVVWKMHSGLELEPNL